MNKVGVVAGFPRTGSTYLLTLLRQRDDTAISEASILPFVIKYLQDGLSNDDSIRSGVAVAQRDRILRSLIPSLANGREHYLDMNRAWTLPYYMNQLTGLLGSTPPVLFQVRPLSEIVASFIRLARAHPGDNYIDHAMRNQDFYPLWHKPIDDARVDWLLSSNGLIGECIFGLRALRHNNTPHLLLRYEAFVSNPLNALREVETLFRMSSMEYKVDRPIVISRDDEATFGIPEFHQIRHGVSCSDTHPEEVLSDYALTRCELEDFWTCESQ